MSGCFWTQPLTSETIKPEVIEERQTKTVVGSFSSIQLVCVQ